MRKFSLRRLFRQGGTGSGFEDHKGRPGMVGGSSKGQGGGASYSNIKGGEFGKGYIVTGKGNVYDVSNEFGGGTNDHVGFIAISENVGEFGLTDQQAEEMLTAYENLDSGPVMDAWDKVFGSGAIRVREFGKEVAIDTKSLDNKTLKRMQKLYDNDKLGFPSGAKITWSDASQNNYISSVSVEEFLDAGGVSKRGNGQYVLIE